MVYVEFPTILSVGEVVGVCHLFGSVVGWRAEGPSDFSTPRLGGVLSRCSVCGFLHIERAVRLPYARLCAQSCVVFRQVPNLTTQFTSHGLGWPEKQVFRHYSKSAERRVWTQDPLVIKQMLYHWATLPLPFVCSIYYSLCFSIVGIYLIHFPFGLSVCYYVICVYIVVVLSSYFYGMRWSVCLWIVVRYLSWWIRFSSCHQLLF